MARQREVRVRRAYDEPRADDGRRILVDHVWPRGLSRERAHLDEWCVQVAPSADLRTWYGHDPVRFDEFARRYRAELDDPERADALAHLRSLAERGTVTLLTGAERSDISQATVLAQLIGAAASSGGEPGAGSPSPVGANAVRAPHAQPWRILAPGRAGSGQTSAGAGALPNSNPR